MRSSACAPSYVPACARGHNATPHKKARPELVELGGRSRAAKIEMKDQPARSPDLNVLDLYVWRVLQLAVDKVRVGSDQQLVDAVVDAWENKLKPWHIEMGYRLMHVHMQQIIAHEGGNNFRTAHTGLRKQMKAEGWTPPEEDLD